MTPTETQSAILNAQGHLLVTGGPGSGKTTVAILKAAAIAESELCSAQRIVFLSFARATVSRVLEAIDEEKQITRAAKRMIEVDTYHSFFWDLLRTHGYLLGLPRRLSILTPPNEAIALAELRSSYSRADLKNESKVAEKAQREATERLRLAHKEGRVCFDLFASLAGQLLNGSDKIRRLVSNAYPVVILDEFQDTNWGQWSVVQALGNYSTLIALADPEQRIFEFIGADPERLDQFVDVFAPSEFDLGSDNHRSRGTDILQFGNDVLKGTFRSTGYEGVSVVPFPGNENQAMATLVGNVLQARERVRKVKTHGWSIGVLVPTRRLTRQVSDIFRNPFAGMPAIPHAAAVDMEGAILAAEIIAHLLEPGDETRHFRTFVELLCAFYRGRGGDSPSQASLKEAKGLAAACDKFIVARDKRREPSRTSIIRPLREVYEAARAVPLTGDPERDWVALRAVLESGACKRLREAGEEVRNIRLLDRGTALRQGLSEEWRAFGSYRNALAIVRAAFIVEHFSTAQKPETGVTVMNIHKVKGKQFDEVIVFEMCPRIAQGTIVANPDRIVRNNLNTGNLAQARLTFRVGITRSRLRTTILTPQSDPCVLLRRQHT